MMGVEVEEEEAETEEADQRIEGQEQLKPACAERKKGGNGSHGRDAQDEATLGAGKTPRTRRSGSIT